MSKKEENDKKAVEGRKKRSEYDKAKATILVREAKNLDKIYAIRSTNGFCKIVSHSALIHKYYIFPRLKRKNKYATLKEPKMFSDEDFGGVASVQGR